MLAGAAGVVPVVGLAACGFQPLYSQRSADADVAANLASVRIDPLRDRVGQQMHNYLRDRLNPDGQPVSPNYRLQVQLRETLTELGVRRDETATRANLRLTAEFTLLNHGGEAALLTGRSSSTTSYDILRNPFATTISEDDARERALREVADDIQTRLALYFSR
ncbi:MAG: LPS assembly lipoprotein LptE [Kiloniellaceae bacterium]